MNEAEVREKYPQYNDLPYSKLLEGLHAKHYSDMPYDEFAAKMGVSPQAPQQPQAPAPSFYDQLRELLMGAKSVAGEFAAGANRAVTGTLDFIGPDTINAGLRLAGVDAQVPTLTGALEPYGIQGGFMQPGLARDAVAAAGEVLPGAVAVGQGLRMAAARLPAAFAGESTGAGVLREMARTTAAQDAIAGSLSGAGGAVGESMDGERGRLVGSVLAPLAAAPFLGIQSAASRVQRGSVPAAEAELIDQGRAAGIPMLTSDVMPPTTFPGRIAQQTAEKIPVAGTAPVRQAQQQMRIEAVDRVANRYGEYSYDAIVASLRAQRDRIKNAAGNILQRTGARLDAQGNVNLANTVPAINTARQELLKPGVIPSANAADDLDQLIGALGTPQTFTTLKENRTAFREIVDSTDNADRSQLTSRAKSLLQDVYAGMTRDMETFAQANLNPRDFAQWQRANSVYADQARVMTRSKLKNVLDKGDVTPEAVKNMLFSQNPSEQRLLYSSLTNEGRANARSAIVSKIINDLNRRASGVTPNSFASELRKYNSQVGAFFRGNERRQLEGLGRVLDATRRAQDASVTTPTGQQLIGGLSITGLYLDPVATLGTAGTVGGLARLYESAPVRTALLRLGSTPPDSSRYAQSVLNAQAAMTAAAQKERDQEDEK